MGGCLAIGTENWILLVWREEALDTERMTTMQYHEVCTHFMTSSACKGNAYLIERALQPAHPISQGPLDFLEFISLAFPHPPYRSLILFALPA